jgi:outer membrane lipoprotein LolB
MRDKGSADETAWTARQMALGPLDRYTLDGRISLAAGRDGWSGTLAWVQAGEALDFQFKGPFGIGGLRIHGDAESLEVRTHKGESFTVTDPERDFTARLGWSIPIRAMRYWLLGVPAPDATFDSRVDAQGRAQELQQHGWTVTYDEYMSVAGQSLPKRFVIERDTVKIKVVVDRWTLTGPGTGPDLDDAGDDFDL